MVIDSRGAVWAPGVVVTAPGFDQDHGFRQRLEASRPEQLVTGVTLNTWAAPPCVTAQACSAELDIPAVPFAIRFLLARLCGRSRTFASSRPD